MCSFAFQVYHITEKPHQTIWSRKYTTIKVSDEEKQQMESKQNDLESTMDYKSEYYVVCICQF